MSRNLIAVSPVVRVGALALGLLLVPLSVQPNGIQPTVACSAEGPDGNCTFTLHSICKFDGEWLQNAAPVQP